jgi:histidine triad (HIT) family protein
MSECVFCQIIQKQIPASIIYEDEQVVAFLSSRPVNEGHTLVVPKKHYENIFDITEKETAYLFIIVKRISQAVKDAMRVDGIRIVQNSGEAAGQVIFHLHVHIIPLKPHNQFTHDGTYRDPNKQRDPEDLDKDAKKIGRHLLFFRDIFSLKN